MKRIVSIAIAVALLCGSLMICAGAAQTPGSLKFKQDGTFKIIQVSDLQEGYKSSSITREFLYDLAKTERPDLFILTGDNIASNDMNWGLPFLSAPWIHSAIYGFMSVFDRIYRDFGIPVTMVYGNHDAEAFTTSREQIFQIYNQYESFIGYVTDADTGTMDADGPHYGTHNLLVYDHAGKAPVFQLWMFDSGGYDLRGGYDRVQKPQIDWFNSTNEITGKLPSFVFQHIIVPEVYDFLTPAKEGDEGALGRTFVDENGNEYQRYLSSKLPKGVKGELREAPSPGGFNDGQYEALRKAGNVMAMFVGHDHVNSYEIPRKNGPDLINTPCAGFGSYGDIDQRGVRVITLRENALNTYKTRLVTYQGFYGDNALRQGRLGLYQNLRTPFVLPAYLIDQITFRPLLWIASLFEYHFW